MEPEFQGFTRSRELTRPEFQGSTSSRELIDPEFQVQVFKIFGLPY